MAHSAPNCGLSVQSKVDSDVLLASLLINVLGLAIPIATLQIFDRVLPNESVPTLNAIFLVMLAVVLVDAVLKMLRVRITLSGGMARERALSAGLLDRLFRGDVRHLSRLGRDAVLDRLQSPARLRILLSGQAAVQRIDMAFSAVYLSVVFLLSGPLALVPVGAIALVLALRLRVGPGHRRALRDRDMSVLARTSVIRTAIERARAMKIFGAEVGSLARYTRHQAASTAAHADLVRASDAASTTSIMIGQATTGVLSLLGGYLVIQGRTDLPSLAACIMLAGRSVQPFLQAFSADAELAQAREAAKSLPEFLALPDMRTPRRGTGPEAQAILLEDVDVLDRAVTPEGAGRLSLAVPRGALVTISGTDSAQASALLGVLAGNLTAARGRVTLHGRPICRGIAADTEILSIFVPRAPRLVAGTIRENLSIHRDSAVDSHALSGLLDVHAEIDMLPGGMEWRFEGSRSGAASPGLCKKIALVAALASEADVLLLDTPDALLDPVTRHLLLDHLVMTKGIATVVVANADPDLIGHADIHVALTADGAPEISDATAASALDETDLIWLDAMADRQRAAS